MRAGRIDELDGLRALAVLAVIAFHYTLGNALANPVTRMGWVGVELFFVLSGYLITGILLGTRERAGYFSTFYARRTLRIFPIYYLLLAVYALSARIWGGPQPWLYWGMHATYLSSVVQYFHYWPLSAPQFVFGGLAVLWSLSIEELYYLVWAPVVRWVDPRRLGWILAVVVVAAPGLRWLIHNRGFTEYEFMPARLDSLAWGAALALWERARGLGPVARWRRLALGVGAGLAVLIAFTGGRRASHGFATLGYTLIGVLFAALLAWVLARAGTAAAACRMLRSRPLRGLGKISYAVYLVHYPVYMLVAAGLGAAVGAGVAGASLRAGLSLAATVAVAAASWRWLEAPILRFKDRWAPALGEKIEPARAGLRTGRVSAR